MFLVTHWEVGVGEKASQMVEEEVIVWLPVWGLLFFPCGFLVVTATKAQGSGRLGEALKAVIASGHSQPNKRTVCDSIKYVGQKPGNDH